METEKFEIQDYFTSEETEVFDQENSSKDEEVNALSESESISFDTYNLETSENFMTFSLEESQYNYIVNNLDFMNNTLFFIFIMLSVLYFYLFLHFLLERRKI